MVHTVSPREESLPEFLAERARHASHGRLLAHACGGLLGALAAFYWGGSGWYILLSLNVCFFAFGMWAIAGRALADQSDAPRTTLRLLRSIRVVTGVVGFAAAAFLMMSLLGKSLGRIIS